MYLNEDAGQKKRELSSFHAYQVWSLAKQMVIPEKEAGDNAKESGEEISLFQ
jgi:hypothetical protein